MYVLVSCVPCLVSGFLVHLTYPSPNVRFPSLKGEMYIQKKWPLALTHFWYNPLRDKLSAEDCTFLIQNNQLLISEPQGVIEDVSG